MEKRADQPDMPLRKADSVVDSGTTVRYATLAEVMGVFEVTLPKHDAVYRELAKDPQGIGAA
jgi:hypothetical protein